MNGVGKSIEIVYLNSENILSGLHTLLARQKDRKLIVGFGGYLFKSNRIREQIKKEAQGAKVLGISKGRMSKINIAFPSDREQQKIADCLTSLDDLITAHIQKLAALKVHKKGLMQNLFSQELRFKDALGKAFPDWVEKRLGEVSTSYSGGTPSSSNMAYYSGDIPFIGSGNIGAANVGQFITREALQNSSAKMVEKGDLLYALYGATSGEVAISKINGAINQAIMCIRSKEVLEYLFQYLLFEKWKILATFLQGGQGNLSAQIIKALKIKLPSKSEQQKIADCLTSLDDLITAHIQKLGALKAHKKGLMQQLFPAADKGMNE